MSPHHPPLQRFANKTSPTTAPVQRVAAQVAACLDTHKHRPHLCDSCLENWPVPSPCPPVTTCCHFKTNHADLSTTHRRSPNLTASASTVAVSTAAAPTTATSTAAATPTSSPRPPPPWPMQDVADVHFVSHYVAEPLQVPVTQALAAASTTSPPPPVTTSPRCDATNTVQPHDAANVVATRPQHGAQVPPTRRDATSDHHHDHDRTVLGRGRRRQGSAAADDDEARPRGGDDHDNGDERALTKRPR
ncbi:hypothetical protein EDB85DRAFT_2149858 [Lactarius pseudohatsudake]|nr:hypothetical protein EDB85DRAFT_2149858 [Lactarius pseudohatsudake]